jgi:hypothetical protein
MALTVSTTGLAPWVTPAAGGTSPRGGPSHSLSTMKEQGEHGSAQVGWTPSVRLSAVTTPAGQVGAA